MMMRTGERKMGRFWKGFNTSVCMVLLCSILLTACGSEKIPVRTMKVEKKPIEALAYANGEVVAEHTAEVTFNNGVLIEQILVQEGAYVNEGQRLAIYDNDKVKQAPMDGVVTAINVKRGAPYDSSLPAFIIMDTRALIVKANIKQSDSPNVRVGQEVYISGDTYGKDKKLTGKIDYIAEVAKTVGEQSFVEIVVRFNGDPPSYLKHGMKVSCDIQLSKKEDALVVTYATIKDSGNDRYVYVVKGGRLEERKVKIGASYGINAEILEGVSEGEYLVMDPKPNFKTGLEVQVTGINQK